MKRLVSSLMAAAMLTGAVAAGGVLAESDAYIYGTMQIPYGAFYAAEGVASEVDAVTSATPTKWSSETLAAGTYSAAHEADAGGDILGVVYPVAITQESLDALADANYGFEALASVPGAYKIVTVEDGAAVFSAVQGETTVIEAEASLSNNTAYGDFVVNVAAINNANGTSDVGTIYGVLLKTTDGAVYGLRHLENIWLDQLAWSVGFVTEERSGNALSSEDYADMMGKTICGITYITETGSHALSTNLYVPVKFDGGVEVASVPAAEGAAAMTLTNLPEDYAPEYAVDGLRIQAEADRLTFTDAMPGAYTLVVSDANGKYAHLRADFILTTDVLPVAYDAETNRLVAADGADPALAQRFIENISAVTVGDVEYSASGKGAVAIVNREGGIDPEAAVTSGRGAEAVTTPVFAEGGEYALTVVSTGFDQSIRFTASIRKE